MEGRLYRAQSLSTLSPRVRSASVDPFAGITKIRDDDFRKSMNNRVTRASRALSVRPDTEDSTLSRRQRHPSESTTPTAAAYLPVATQKGDKAEYWPTTVTGPAGHITVRYGSVQPDLLRRRSDIDYAVLPIVTAHRNRVLNEADNAVGRGNRISALLEQLKNAEGHRSRYQQEIDGIPPSSRSTCRDEVDLFADVLDKVPLPTLQRIGGVDVRRRGNTDAIDAEDFISRLTHARGDLHRVEGLASKTFNWNDGFNKSTTTAAKGLRGASPQLALETGQKVIETTQSPKEVFTFFNDKRVGIKQSDSAAEQAIKWAQQRRLLLESDINSERKRERYSFQHPPSTVSALGLLSSRKPEYHEKLQPTEESFYDSNETVFSPRYVPMVPWSANSRRFARGIDAIATTDDYEYPTRAYNRRSLSATNVELGRAPYTERRSQRGAGTSIYSMKPNQVQQQTSGMSEARRRVREVLAKSKGDPHYWDRRPNDEDDE